MKNTSKFLITLAIFNLPFIVSAQDSAVVNDKGTQPLVARGSVKSGVLKVNCYYTEEIPGTKHEKDKAYGELNSAPTYKTHYLDSVKVSVFSNNTLIRTGYSDMAGNCEWDKIPAGKYTITADNAPYNKATLDKRVLAGSQNDVGISMTK